MCLSVCQLFPYFYFRAENDPAFENAEQLRRLLPFVAVELEKANSVTQQQHKATNAAATEQDKIVAKVCARKPMAFLALTGR